MDGQTVKRAAEGVEEADLRSRDMDTGERTCRSSHVRDSSLGHPVAAVAHFCCEGTGSGGQETGLPAGREEDASETSQEVVYCKRWAAKHECEELKEGVWLEPIQAMLRRKTNEPWTDNHRNVMRKLVVEGGGCRKDCATLSHEKKCRGFNKEEGTEKHRLYHCPSWRWVRNQVPQVLESWEQRARTSQEDWRWQ